MTTTKHQRPWYAHEYPDRPLTAGAHLCCCIPCALAIERCGHEDSRREVLIHTGLGVLSCRASYLADRRGNGQFHDMFHYTSGARINWIHDIEVGPRRGRPTRQELAEYEQNRGARALLEACVLHAVRQQIERAELEMAMHWARVDANDYSFMDEDGRDDYGRRFGY